MSREQNSGELSDESFHFKEITWKIPNVLHLPKRIDYKVRSPEFSFANGTWVFCMYPNGQREHESESHIDFTVYRLQSLEAQQDVYYKFFIRTSKGKEFEPFEEFYDFTSVGDCDDGVGVLKYLKFSKLVAMHKALAPEGALTVVCQLRIKCTAEVETTSEEKIDRPVRRFIAGSHCMDGEKLGGASKDCRENSIETCTQTEGEFDCVTDQLKAAAPNQKFVLDYKRLLLSEEGCDVTLQVKGQKFEAHRTILRARSSVFASMFSHDMKESKTGLIDIVDCDPECFHDFLRFLYCGSVDSITSQNTCSLYRAADKYDVQDLKSECLAFIKSHLDVDNFCDVVTLTLQHGEADLLKQATEFFAKNMPKIIVTVKWQVFLHENTTQGNELLIKAVGADKSSNP